MANALEAASGRWPELLQSLAHLSADQLTDTHQPCPACGGEDRYRWDQDDADGGWYCNQCGGKNHQGGGGSGMDLLTRVTGWDFKQACRHIERHLGIATGGPAPVLTPAPRAPAKPKGRPHRIPGQPPLGTPPPALGSAVAQFPYGPDRENPCYWIQRVPQPAKAEGEKPGKLFIHRTWLDGRWHYPSKKDAFKSEWPTPRPVYRLPDLIDRPDAPVLISEGEGKTDAAIQLFPEHVCIAWTGGTGGVAHTDWQHLTGRKVTLWPDADDKGRACMDKLAQILLPIASSVHVVNPPSTQPQGWDLADALAEGWKPAKAAKALLTAKPVEPSPAEPEPADPEPKQPSPGHSARQLNATLTMAEIGEQLREAIADGIGGADLAELVVDLANAGEQSSINIQRLADAIRAEQRQAAEVVAESRTLAAEADRQEIGQQLTADFLLPARIAAAIEARSRYLPCEGPSAVLPFLTAVAGLVKLGTEVEGCAVAGYRVPINLFACLVGRSGAKKSPISRLLADEPTQVPRAEMTRSNQKDREAWEESCKEAKKGERTLPPFPKRLVISDFTGEALAAQLQTQEAAGLGLLVNRDELSGLFGSLNAYRGGRGADEQQLLELFDGSGLSSLRIVGDRHYSRSQVSIWGSTQPDVLRQLVANGDASGLWARFLFVPLPERAIPLPLAASADELDEVEAAKQTLSDACQAVYRLPRRTYSMDSAAAEKFANYELNRQHAALRASIGAQSALYGKSSGKALRLAGVLHLLQIAAKEIDGNQLIGPATIDRATALVDHLDAWSLSLHAEAAAGGVGGLMRTVHRTAENVGDAVRWKEIQNRLTRAQRKETDPAAVAEAMRALEAGGFGEVVAGKRGALGYRAVRALP